jgi:hypothetical protein
MGRLITEIQQLRKHGVLRGKITLARAQLQVAAKRRPQGRAKFAEAGYTGQGG